MTGLKMGEQRLIDATALEQDLISKGFYPAIVKRAIEKAPTVETEPVRHGKWMSMIEYCQAHDLIPSGVGGIYWWCSECEDAETQKRMFCPNCGARMDGDDT